VLLDHGRQQALGVPADAVGDGGVEIGHVDQYRAQAVGTDRWATQESWSPA
jgi:hypothetical protein